MIRSSKEMLPVNGIAHDFDSVSIVVFRFDPVLSKSSLFTGDLTFGIVQTPFNPDLFSLT